MAMREEMGTDIPKSFVERVKEGVRYVLSGKKGEDWFGPGKPMKEVAPQAEGRRFDFPTSLNLTNIPRHDEGVSFAQLRGLADNYDLLRLIIETRKDQIESYEWEIQAKEDKEVSDEIVEKVKTFFLSPDKENGWSTWLRQILEDLFVIDTVVIYPRKTRGGDLYSLDLIDGATIKRVLDATGRTPLPPDPAYQQILKGLPAVDYTREELLYLMRNPRTYRIYGYSPVEQIIMTVNIALRRQIHQLQYYTEGNIPEAIAGLPETWSLEQIKDFQTYWDSVLEGNTARRRKMKFVPFDPNRVKFTKEPEQKSEFDEWLARVCCFAFSISPTMLVKETNRATAESVQEAAKSEGLVPLLNWLRAIFNRIIAEQLGQPDLEFSWKVQKDLDPVKQAEVDKIYLDAKVILPEEVRERIGMPPLTPEQEEKLNPPLPPGMGFPGQPASGSALPRSGAPGGGMGDPQKGKKPPKGAEPKPKEKEEVE